MTYYDTYKVVTDSLANVSYALLQCGFPTPNDLPTLRTFSIPLTSLSILETVPYAYLELLGITDRVFDVSEFVVAPCGQRLVQGCGRASPDSLEASNDTLLADSVGDYTDGVVIASPLAWPTQFSFSGASSPGLLQRAEWIKYLGTFFNLDAYASQVYSAIERNYKRVAAAAQGSPSRPVIAWVSHFVYGEEENFQLSFAAYKTELVRAAGGVPLNASDVLAIEGTAPSAFSADQIVFGWGANGTFASKEAALEAFLDVLADADYVIDETFVADPTSYNFTSFVEQFSAGDVGPSEDDAWVAAQRIYRPDKLLSESMGWDWYEGAIPRADRVLEDVVSFVYPQAVAADYARTWMRHISEEPVVVGPGDCAAPQNGCSAAPATICPYISFCGDGTPVLLETNLTTGTAVGNRCTYAACSGASKGGNN